MKKLAAMLCLSVMATGAFAQGLVNFANNPQTLVSANIAGSLANISGPSGSYYFALLTSANAYGPVHVHWSSGNEPGQFDRWPLLGRQRRSGS